MPREYVERDELPRKSHTTDYSSSKRKNKQVCCQSSLLSSSSLLVIFIHDFYAWWCSYFWLDGKGAITRRFHVMCSLSDCSPESWCRMKTSFMTVKPLITLFSMTSKTWLRHATNLQKVASVFFFYSHARTSTKLCDISHGADVPLPVHVVLKLILIQAMQMLLWLV